MSDVESTNMLERVDRIQMAVVEAAPAARAFQDLLGAEPAREDDSEYLQAHRTPSSIHPAASTVSRSPR